MTITVIYPSESSMTTSVFFFGPIHSNNNNYCTLMIMTHDDETVNNSKYRCTYYKVLYIVLIDTYCKLL